MLIFKTCHVHAVLSLQRIAQVPWTFKDGFSIPAGAMVAFPGYHQAHDPELHPDPETCDPRRHLRKREVANDTDDGDSQQPQQPQQPQQQRYRFTSVSDDLFHFGSGIHACPGRFFAQESLKLIWCTCSRDMISKWRRRTKMCPRWWFGIWSSSRIWLYRCCLGNGLPESSGDAIDGNSDGRDFAGK